MATREGRPASIMNKSPPYPPDIWTLGGAPKKGVDIPITAVFSTLFIIGAAMHMKIFQKNRGKGHKFLFNFFLFAFCMARVVTSILRIASTSFPMDIQLGIAAQIFVAAGVLIIFIINLVWTQRIVRSLHPNFGWHRAPSIFIRVVYVLTGLTLVILITATVQSFYTLNANIRKIDRALQLYGSTFLAIISFLPIPIVSIALAVPCSSEPERFGTGKLRTKLIVLLAGSSLVSLGAWYRCGTSWHRPVPRSEPLPGYFSKACFYIFNFAVETLTVYLYGITRVDLRFHVPDGANGPGSYETKTQGAGGVANSADTDTEKGSQELMEREDDDRKDSLLDEQRRKEYVEGKSKNDRKSKPAPIEGRKSMYTREEEAAIIKRLGGPWELKQDNASSITLPPLDVGGPLMGH